MCLSKGAHSRWPLPYVTLAESILSEKNSNMEEQRHMTKNIVPPPNRNKIKNEHVRLRKSAQTFLSKRNTIIFECKTVYNYADERDHWGARTRLMQQNEEKRQQRRRWMDIVGKR